MIVRDYYIAKYSKLSAYSGPLMVLWAILLAIQNIYINLNPATEHFAAAPAKCKINALLRL